MRKRRILGICLAAVCTLSMAFPAYAVNADNYPTQTENQDSNIAVTKSAEWAEDFHANIKISVTGLNDFTSHKTASDVVLVVDNSNSMYTPECYNENHVVYLPYKSEAITDGVFAEEKTESSVGYLGDVIDEAMWKETLIPAIAAKIQNSEMGWLFDFTGKDYAETVAMITDFGKAVPMDLFGFMIDVPETNFYISCTDTDSGGTPGAWALIDKATNLPYSSGDIVSGVFYGEKTTTEIKAIPGNGVITDDSWTNDILPQIQGGFTPGMVVAVPGHTNIKLIYTGKVNTADPSYAANQESVDNMLNWTLIDTSESYTADIYGNPDIVGDPDLLFAWIGYVNHYHFDISNGLARVGEVMGDGTFYRNVFHAQADGCVVKSSIVKRNILELANLLLADGSENRVSIIFFEDKVFETLSFTNSTQEISDFLDVACETPKTNSTYNTNYEAAWASAAEMLDTARADAARFVSFLTDGWPTAAGTGDDTHTDTHQAPAALAALVNGADGIKAKYHAVVSTVAIGLEAQYLADYVNPLATDPSLQMSFTGDASFSAQLGAAVQEIYQKIYLWAKNVVLTDYISPEYTVNRAELQQNYPDAQVFTEVIDGVAYEKVVVPMGDIVGDSAATVVIPVTLKEAYQSPDSQKYYPTNADRAGGLTITYTDPNDEQLHPSVSTATPYLPVPDIPPKPATVVLTAEKKLTGKTLSDGQFSFQLKDNRDRLIETVKNKADGRITFSELTFAETGEYTYTISEINDGQSGVTYDKISYSVVITVTKHGASLVAEAEYPEGDTVFTNMYQSAEVTDDPDTSKPTTPPTEKPTTPPSTEKPTTPSSPQTGDDSNPVLWMTLAVFSLAVLCGISLLNRKEKCSKREQK